MGYFWPAWYFQMRRPGHLIPKVRHTSRTPYFLVVHAYIHTCMSLEGFVLVGGDFCLGGFVRGRARRRRLCVGARAPLNFGGRRRSAGPRKSAVARGGGN